MIDLNGMSDSELEQLIVEATAEREHRRALAAIPQQMADLAAIAEAAQTDREPVPYESLTDRVAPGQRVVWSDGQTWRNSSGAWLPISASPEAYPLGWQQLTELPATVPASEAGERVQAGDLRTYGGVVSMEVEP